MDEAKRLNDQYTSIMGAELSKECPECGSDVAPAFATCPECGHEFDEDEEELQDKIKAKMKRCPECGTKFKKVDEHTWKPDCDCYDEPIRVCIG